MEAAPEDEDAGREMKFCGGAENAIRSMPGNARGNAGPPCLQCGKSRTAVDEQLIFRERAQRHAGQKNKIALRTHSGWPERCEEHVAHA